MFLAISRLIFKTANCIQDHFIAQGLCFIAHGLQGLADFFESLCLCDDFLCSFMAQGFFAAQGLPFIAQGLPFIAQGLPFIAQGLPFMAQGLSPA